VDISGLKTRGKRLALATGLYRPARYISDRLTNRAELKKIAEEAAFYSAVLKPDSLCFDIGANKGMKTLSLLKAGARVIAFEPQPRCAQEISARCGKYGPKITVCEKAMGSSEGTLTLHTDDFFNAYGSFYPDWEGGWNTEIPVEVTTLDSAIVEYGRPDYCKIDVEGWEFEVLSGLSEKIPLVSFEYHLSEREKATTRKCVERLSLLAGNKIELNVAPAEATDLFLENWVSEDTFWNVFPAELEGRPGFDYGDIWVRCM
jgi:FkbM family methyltransferase